MVSVESDTLFQEVAPNQKYMQRPVQQSGQEQAKVQDWLMAQTYAKRRMSSLYSRTNAATSPPTGESISARLASIAPGRVALQNRYVRPPTVMGVLSPLLDYTATFISSAGQLLRRL